MESLFTFLLLFVTGGAIGFVVRKYVALGKQKSIELTIQEASLTAKNEAQKITSRAEEKAQQLLQEIRDKEESKDQEYKKTEDRLIKKEQLLDERQSKIDVELKFAQDKKDQLSKLIEEAKENGEKEKLELERIAGLTQEDAKNTLITTIERDYAEDLLVRIRKQEEMNKEELHKRAQDIIVTAMQRLAQPASSDLTTTSIQIPSEELKGKIIGKEGRNIKAFERAACVELIVDDTPGTIIISSFDPVRRQVARLALENLILDGRIQPAKIEEFVKKAQEEINTIIREKGEQAVQVTGVFNLDPKVITVLGRLYFRTSYGQNVLEHSIEMTHLAGMIAEEVGADVTIAKAGALVHDIGKALDHEVQGTHIEIGIRILRKFGTDERVITAMKSHHDDYPHETLEAVIVQTADMISGGRPGARRDSVENYVKRLEELERLAMNFPGIEKVYALSAGREIRIFVYPETMNDLQSKEVAKEIARKIEQDLKYPGEIKVTVIREQRIIEYAR